MLKYNVIIITNKSMTDEEFSSIKGKEIEISQECLKEGVRLYCESIESDLPIYIGIVEKLTRTKDGDYLEIVTTKNIWTLERID